MRARIAAASAALGRPGGRAGCLGGPLGCPGAHRDPGQVGQQRGGLAEGDLRAGPGDHLAQARRQRRPGCAQLLIPRREAVPAFAAVVPGPHHPHRPQHRGDGLGPAPGEARLVAAGALDVRAGIPVPVAGQHRFQQPRAGRGQRGAHRLLQHPQRRALPEHPGGQPGQGCHLGGGDLGQAGQEPPLSPSAGGDTAGPAAGRAAQIASLTAVTSSTRAANR